MEINLSKYIDLSRFVKNNNIHFLSSRKEISYPKEGNSLSFQIEEKSWWFQFRNKFIASYVMKYAPNATFWDIGGGNGFVSKELQENGITTILVEPGIEGANNASNRGLNHIFCATLEELHVNAAMIESAGLFDVLEHIENAHEFLSEINNSMQKEGKLFITVPAYNFLWSVDDDYAGHFKRYTLNSLNQTLDTAGFEMVKSTYFYSVLIIPIFFFRTLKQKIKGTKKQDVNNLAKAENEHGDQGILVNIMKPIWKFELWMINKGIHIPFGASCLIVAKKV
jgi:2-polyprenyl-3-methyl-5-hydroxy-6-metoxy-1,4-benzoquinol methylase